MKLLNADPCELKKLGVFHDVAEIFYGDKEESKYFRYFRNIASLANGRSTE